MRIQVVLTAIFLTGCAQTVQLQSAFDPKQAAYINVKGKASIAGQAFLRRNDGVVVYAAGSEVNLVPVTAYAEERVAAIYNGRKLKNYSGIPIKFEGEDPTFQTYQRKIKANGEGRFVFADVGPGAYIVNTIVSWCAPSQYGCLPQGGQLMDRITIAGAEKAELILNGD